MTNITESFLRGKIAESITSAETVPFTKKVSKVPELSVGYITISPETADEEIVHYTATSGTPGQSGTITISTRGYNKSGITTNVSNQKSHAINSLFKGALNHLIINEKPDKTDLASSLNGKGASTIGIEDNAGQFVGTNVETALVELANGAPGVADGSETIAGKFEEATQVETDAGTILGTSGAHLVVTAEKFKAGLRDDALSTSDITTNNSSTTKHGFLTKLSGKTTDTLLGNGIWGSILNIIGGTIIRAISSGAISTGSSTPVLAKTLSAITIDGTYTITLNVRRVSNDFSDSFCQFYKNGVATGAVRTAGNVASGFATFTEDITLVSGDIISSYIWGGTGANPQTTETSILSEGYGLALNGI